MAEAGIRRENFPAQVALDGTGANSPFVRALVEHLPTPGLEIGKLLQKPDKL